jgi:hypothetical protein
MTAPALCIAKNEPPFCDFASVVNLLGSADLTVDDHRVWL